MNRVVASSLRQGLLVIVMTLLLVCAGSRSLIRLPVDAYPDLSPPIVEIITQWPGRASEEVERLITVPIEHENERYPAHCLGPFHLAVRLVRRHPDVPGQDR